jgi:hypothetical protein
MDEAREIWRAAEQRWLAQPGASRGGLMGILIGTIMTEGHPELLVKAAAYADEFGSVDQIVNGGKS